MLNHVCLHQTVIGQEAIRQMELAGEEPDSIIACCGGGSNFAGLAFPFLQKKITEKKKYRIVAVEPSACPSLTKGELRYDFGDTAETTPLLMMYTLGHKFMPPPIHAGGLRYHGMSPMVSHALKLGLIEAEAYHQTKVFEAATLFARTEGIVPAPESAHAIAAVIEEAEQAREAGKEARDPVQSFGPRAARPERLRNLPRRQNPGCVNLPVQTLKYQTNEKSNSFVSPRRRPGGRSRLGPGPTRPITFPALKASRARRCRRPAFTSGTTTCAIIRRN